MRALDRKLLRDLQRIWTQALAIAAVIAAGIAVCLTMLSALASLETTRDDYYARFRFADLFATVNRAPLSVIDRLRALPGIETVEPRVVADVTLDVAGLREPAVGRLISIPDAGEPALNRLLLRRGGYPAPGDSGSVVASEAFALAHRLEIGDAVSAVINGRRKRLIVAGIGLSPEYVYSIRAGDLFPDDARFGVLWMRRKALATAFDLDGAFNDAVMRLSPNARTPDLIAAVDAILAPYGGAGAYVRADQTSAWYLENELSQLRNMGRVTPFIFAAVAAFLLNVVISRLVAAERERIGILKAFGYSTGAVAGHYLALVLSIVAVGVAIGTAVGAWMGYEWTRMYAAFFRFPSLAYHLPLAIVAASVAGAVAVGTSATLGAVWRAARIPPADAMRPEAPGVYRPGLLDRLGVARHLPHTARLIVRNLERRPVRAVLSVAAIALAVAVVIVGLFSVDAVHYLTDVEFNAARRQDVTVTLVQPRSRPALHALARLPGVLRAEPTRAVPVRLRNGYRSRRLALIGVDADASLARVIDDRLRPVRLPPDGVVLNDALASKLALRIGERVTVEVLEGARPVRELLVSDVVPEYLGLSAYMDLAALNRLMREGPVISGAFLQIDAAAASDLYARLKATPEVASVTIANAARKSFEETLSEVVRIVTTMFAAFGAAIAFAVVYNNARIALAERARDLGTLHVLGFSHGELAEILLGEMALLTAVGVPLGVLAGRALAGLTVVLFETELFRIPLIVAPATDGTGAAVTLAAAALSGVAIWRRLLRMDVLAVLKAPE